MWRWHTITLSAISPHSGVGKLRGKCCFWDTLMFAVQIMLAQKMRVGLLLSDLRTTFPLLYILCAYCRSDTVWLSVARINQTFSQFLLSKLLSWDGPNILWLRIPLEKKRLTGRNHVLSCMLTAGWIKGSCKAFATERGRWGEVRRSCPSFLCS